MSRRNKQLAAWLFPLVLVVWLTGCSGSGALRSPEHVSAQLWEEHTVRIAWDAVEGAVTFPKEGWGPGTSTAIQAVILREYPGTPPLLVWLFSQVH